MPIRAAQYLRTSKGLSRHSVDRQAAAILKFAKDNGFVIVQTYEDLRKSGLTIRNRAGLRQLLKDVLAGVASYNAILVFDVSRWGRFQDIDEAAHYEFICKQAGIPVHYCAEPLKTSNFMQDAVQKSLKRLMAAEFSRRLSTKCFKAQMYIAQMGFRVGGPPGYGLRRLSISADRKRTKILRKGDYKTLSTDRVLLVPGPAPEVRVIRGIYRMVLRDRKTPSQIAELLNNRSKTACHRWTRFTVQSALTNPKYAGISLWNVRTQRLSTLPRMNQPDEWIVRSNPFGSVVGIGVFERVQRTLKAMGMKWADDHLLKTLLLHLPQKGQITRI